MESEFGVSGHRRTSILIMKSEFRSTSPRDAGAISAFMQRILAIGPEHPVIEPQHLHWKNWEDRADWPGSRGYVITRESEIVAHGTVVPLLYQWQEKRLKVVYLIDWVADPKSPGSGVSLLQRIGRLADAILVIGGSEVTLKILPALGFKIRGEVTLYVLPLRPTLRLAHETKLGFRSAARFVRSLLWWLQAPSGQVEGWDVRRIAPDQLAQTAVLWPKPGPEIGLFERSGEAMSYFMRCPSAAMEMYAVTNAGSIRGYFLLAFALAQARLVDLWIDSVEREDWRTLIQLAVRTAKQTRGVVELVSMGNDPLTTQGLLDCGFHMRGSSPFFLLARAGSDFPDVPIRFQMIDGDESYRHSGCDEFWA
jgi:hypothetical protein